MENYKNPNQTEIEFPEEEKDSSGMSREDIIGKYQLRVILKEDLSRLYFDPETKEWRIKDLNKSPKELFAEVLNKERESDQDLKWFQK